MRIQTIQQLDVTAEHVPGSMAMMAQALADAGISIDAICHTEDKSENTLFYLICNNNSKAKEILLKLGKKVAEKNVISISCKNEVGVIAAVSQALATAQVNMEEIYTGTATADGSVMFVVGVADAELQKATIALKMLEK